MKLNFFGLFVALSFIWTTFAQNVYYDYQDGLVVFQLKESANLIPSKGKWVDHKRFDIFNAVSAAGIDIEEVLRLHPDLHDDNKLNRTYQIRLADPYKVDQVVRIMHDKDEVLYAELKDLHRTLLTPNDLGVNSTSGWNPQVNQWALHKVKAQEAWDFSTGSASVKVAVTDDAFKVDHPDLVNKMLPGRDVVANNNNPTPCGSTDGFHGTHVAGIVGAETDNGIGIASIGWNVSIIPVKIANCSGQLTGGYDGVIWAAQNGADVINMSWGGGSAGNYGQNIMNNAQNAGCILVAAAGNDGNTTVLYPAGYPNVIAVASSDPNDSKSNFSQYGSFIDITAPGSFMRSTIPNNNGYQNSQGTSMACPLVAGFMGLLKSYAPDATNAQLIQCLYDGADNINAQNANFIGQLGAGRMNALASMQCAQQYAVSFDYDASIASISAPTGTFCGGSFTPQVELKNFGQVTLTSVKINYSWGSVNSTFNWTGSLANGQSQIVSLPAQTAQGGTYTFSASTSEPNNQQDENTSNDQSTSPFTVDGSGEPVELNLVLDCYGSDISWEIRNNQTNAVVRSGGGYTDNANGQTINEAFCLPPACYTFTINDSYGDGLNGSIYQGCTINGNFNMKKGDGTTLFQMSASNGAFDDSESHEFCLSTENPNPDPNPDPSASLEDQESANNMVKVYPNPTSGSFVITMKGLKDQTSVQVIDLMGRQVIAPKVIAPNEQKEIAMDLSGFQKGVYLVLIETEGRKVFKRVVLK